MKFDKQHLSRLKAFSHDRQIWVGQNLRSYAGDVLEKYRDCDESLLMDRQASRNDIFRLAQDSSVSARICSVAIFGWGGMRRNHARDCLKLAQSWISIVEDIKLNKLSRTEAYSSFLSLRLRKSLPGMGPAFFTKLIYFFGEQSSSRGYIMDQWTARSANLLLGRQFIHLVKNKKNQARVSDKNSKYVYEEFCQFIEALASELNSSTDAVEEMIFSSGNIGRKQTRGAWREYVLEHT